MHQSATANAKSTVNEKNALSMKTLVQNILALVGKDAPLYGEVAITFLAGKPTKVEKRESFRP